MSPHAISFTAQKEEIKGEARNAGPMRNKKQTRRRCRPWPTEGRMSLMVFLTAHPAARLMLDTQLVHDKVYVKLSMPDKVLFNFFSGKSGDFY